MKRALKWIALVGMMISLNSCGLPGAIGRSIGRIGQAVAAAA